MHRIDHGVPFSSWGNVFLLLNWELHVDWNKQQHDAVLHRLGIDPVDVAISGSVRTLMGSNEFRIWWRGTECREINEKQRMQMIRLVELEVIGFSLVQVPSDSDETYGRVF